MLQIAKSLSGATPNALINKSFSLNQLNRFFKFTEEDSYVRIFSKHHDRHLPGRGPLVSNRMAFRYDSAALLRQSLKSSVDVDLQNILNSYLVSTVALTATRFQAHEFGARRGLRSGLLVGSVTSNSYYGGPYPVGFDTFVDNFINYYNNIGGTSLRGTITSVSPKNVDFHKPEFSCGSYKGAPKPDSIRKAHQYLLQARARFDEFFKSLQGAPEPGTGTTRGRSQDTESFEIRMFELRGTENSTSYGRGESTQAIPQQEPIRDKDGLYAIMKVPRTANIRAAQDARRGDMPGMSKGKLSYDPIYSNLFNAYADNPELGDSFLALSGCIVIKLDSFLNKQAYTHTTEFPTMATMNNEFSGASLGLSNNSPRHATIIGEDYQTFGPLSHMILPESIYADADEAQIGGRYGRLRRAPQYTKQELLDLREPSNPNSPHRDPNFFVGEGYTSSRLSFGEGGSRYIGGHPNTKLHNCGSRIFNEQAKQFYCWVGLNDPRYMNSFGLSTGKLYNRDSYMEYVTGQLTEPVYSRTAADLARINGQYIFGFGSVMQEPVKEQTLIGYISYNMSDDKKFRDVFSFYSPFPLNQENLHTEKKQSILLNHKVTKDITKRGKGYIYVDQENIAYCPLSGEALKVRTYRKQSEYNQRTPLWGERSPLGVLIS